MPLDSDVALLGTGLAPLIAASRLLSEGKSVLILNPDWDFFREDSELPLDPFWPRHPKNFTPARLIRSSPEHVLSVLRPPFPGAIEFWPEAENSGGYHDDLAPHVRSRDRLWLRDENSWEVMEDMYVEAADAGLNPRLVEGAVAHRLFPGFSMSREPLDDLRGILLPRLCDVDVSRYRNGVLEFVRERVGAQNWIVAASQIELTSEGISFRSRDFSDTARLRDGLLVFWTPRLTHWVNSQIEKNKTQPPPPLGIRLWEEWSLVSREPVEANLVGVFEDMTVWVEVEGHPDRDPHRRNKISVLRAGPLIPWGEGVGMMTRMAELPWASADSFNAISRLCHDFLGWQTFSIRSLRPRALFEWEPLVTDVGCWMLQDAPWKTHVVCGGDGSLVDVVQTAGWACEHLLAREGA